MPRFKKGDPQVTFKRKDGKLFKKTFHTPAAARKAVKGWRANGGSTKKGKYLTKFSGKRK